MNAFGGYFEESLKAFVRGRLGAEASGPGLLNEAARAGLRIHKFKRKIPLARVSRVLGILHALQPETLLDLGTGRGTFLWPLLDAFPNLQVTAVDSHPQRWSDLAAVRKGGVTRLSAVAADAESLPFRAGAFDVATLLEVLEHTGNPQAVVNGSVAAARRFVIVSVPSKPDENPEHIHLFSQLDLASMLERAGAKKIHFDGVANHRIVLAHT